MSVTDSILPFVRDEIYFDCLSEQAQQTLAEYAGESWSDTAEHDPGVTLLEALGYGIADLAYRQTLPLTDLLTPPPSQQTGEGIFPVAFGPHQALTCGPVSEDDYRRALLDLHSSDTENGYFLFHNVQLVCEPEADRYQYWYNTRKREYSFTEPSPEDEPVMMTLRGNYQLYLVPSRETQADPTEAMALLDSFLLNNRNLGEAVSRIIWLTPEAVMVNAVIELQDDIGQGSNIAAILADVYRVTDAFITPPVQRYSTEQLLVQGVSREEIYQGPWLENGWIPRLPPAMDGTVPAVLNLSGLVNALLSIEGIRAVRSLGTDQNNPASPWQWIASAPGCYPCLWGDEPLSELTTGGRVRLLAGGDVEMTATADDIAAELESLPPVRNQPEVLPYGRWRDPGRYYPATARIPPCYNALTPATTQAQIQLHQFLLSAEQLLANGCGQQALLPDLLAFQRQGDVVWGQQWPFADGSVADQVHQDYRNALQDVLQQGSHDREQELRLVGFLLGYFNSQLAPEIFLQSPDAFLASQQGYLSRHTELTCHRANIRTDRLSPLHRRIAARLGLGGSEVFDDDTPLDTLPFYLIEHRALLPVEPHPDYNMLQTPVQASQETLEGQDFLTLTLDTGNVGDLLLGQLIDVTLMQPGGDFTVRGLMIKRINPAANSFSVDIATNKQLQRNLEAILSSAPDQLGWQNSPVWLEDMNYPLVYAEDQSHLGEHEKRLACTPFPVMATVGDTLVMETRNVVFSSDEMVSTRADSPVTLTITAIDRIKNTLVVSMDSGSPFPSDDQSRWYFWYFSSNGYASTDRFSLMVSLVFNQSLLLGLESDPYATEAWVKETILSEIPSHIGMLFHWMPPAKFEEFGLTYRQWREGGSSLGDKSYDLLSMLALGQLPDGLGGIGSMYIATVAQREAVVGDGSEWNSDVIVQDQLFYVPGSLPDNNDPTP